MNVSIDGITTGNIGIGTVVTIEGCDYEVVEIVEERKLDEWRTYFRAMCSPKED